MISEDKPNPKKWSIVEVRDTNVWWEIDGIGSFVIIESKTYLFVGWNLTDAWLQNCSNILFDFKYQ